MKKEPEFQDLTPGMYNYPIKAEIKKEKIKSKFTETRIKIVDLLLYGFLTILNGLMLAGIWIMNNRPWFLMLVFIVGSVIHYCFGRVIGQRDCLEEVKEE